MYLNALFEWNMFRILLNKNALSDEIITLEIREGVLNLRES